MTYFIPGCRDVLHVSALLALTPLPLELIDVVLEWAEYWPRITATLDDAGPETVTRGSFREHARILRLKPICSGAADRGRFINPVSEERDVYHRPVNTVPATKENIDDAITSEGNYITSNLWHGVTSLVRLFTGDLIYDDPSAQQEGIGSRAQYYASLPDHALMEPRAKYPVRRIVWKIRSHDQGWGGEGGDMFENSWTGFRGSAQRFRSNSGESAEHTDPDRHSSDVYLEHFEETAAVRTEPLQAGEVNSNDVWSQDGAFFKETHVQINRRANKEWKDHHVIWDFRDDIDKDDPRALTELRKLGRGVCTGDGSLVRALSRGDSIELWSFAFFPGWTNHVQGAEVTVEFAL